MKKKFTLLLLCGLFFTANLNAQTWNIGSPTATNVTATLHNGTLAISGAGAMMDWSAASVPWDAVRTSIHTVIILNGVTTIGTFAFSGATGLTSVTIPNSVTSIGISAFQSATGLTSVSIPNSVTSIGSSAFRGATGLTSVTIPNSVTIIGNSAFRGATGLTSVTIPNSVTSIGDSAFGDATSLTSVTVEWATPLSINTNVFSNVQTNAVRLIVPAGTEDVYRYANVWGNFLIGEDEDIVWQIGNPNREDVRAVLHNNTLTISGTGAMMNWSAASVPWDAVRTSIYTVILNGVTTIGTFAFSGATGLTSVSIPNSVTTIGASAFRDCTALTSVIIGNSVTHIQAAAFTNTGLTSVTIPNSVTSIGGDVFWGCTALTSINVASDNPNFSSINGVLFNRNQTTLIQYPLGSNQYKQQCEWHKSCNRSEQCGDNYNRSNRSRSSTHHY